MYTRGEVTLILGVCPRKVDNLLSKNELYYFKSCNNRSSGVRIPESAIVEYLERTLV